MLAKSCSLPLLPLPPRRRNAAGGVLASSEQRHIAKALREPPRRHTLVLDIDRTLTTGGHGVDAATSAATTTTRSIGVNHKNNGLAGSPARPHLQPFLRSVARWFEVVVWTAGSWEHCNTMMDRLDTEKVLDPRLRLCADHTVSSHHTENLSSSSRFPYLAKRYRSVVDSHLLDHEEDFGEKLGCHALVDPELLSGFVCPEFPLTTRRLKWLALLGRPLKNLVLFDDRRDHGRLTPRNIVYSRGWHDAASCARQRHLWERSEDDDNLQDSTSLLSSSSLSVSSHNTHHHPSPYCHQSRNPFDEFNSNKRVSDALPVAVNAEDDSYLRDILPLLHSVASAPSVIDELDHWRPSEYTVLDDVLNAHDLGETRWLLGNVVAARRRTPIAAWRPSKVSRVVNVMARSAMINAMEALKEVKRASSSNDEEIETQDAIISDKIIQLGSSESRGCKSDHTTTTTFSSCSPPFDPQRMTEHLSRHRRIL